MFVTNVTRGPVSLDGIHTIKTTDRRVFYEDTADNIDRAVRMVKSKQLSVGFTDSLLAIAKEPITPNSMIHISENEDGVLYCKRASDANVDCIAHGFSALAYPTGEVVRVYLEGCIVFHDNLEKNRVYYLGSGPGSITTTEPTAADKVYQVVGVAITTDLLLFINSGYEVRGSSGGGSGDVKINIKFRKFKKVLSGDTDRTITLAATPEDCSESVYWNGVLIEEYIVSNNIVTIDSSVKIRAGDVFTVKYMTIESVDTATSN